MSTMLAIVLCALFLVLGICIGMVVGISENERKKSRERGLGGSWAMIMYDIKAALDLLAVIHRDGGQHTNEVGFVQSCKDAEDILLRNAG